MAIFTSRTGFGEALLRVRMSGYMPTRKLINKRGEYVVFAKKIKRF